MNEQWIQEYLKEHPKEPFWKYLQNNPEQSEILLKIDYEMLNWMIEKAKSLEISLKKSKTIILPTLKQDRQNELFLSIEEKILLGLIKLTQNLDVHCLSLLFAISGSKVEDICSYWQSIFQKNHLLWHKINLVKRGEVINFSTSNLIAAYFDISKDREVIKDQNNDGITDCSEKFGLGIPQHLEIRCSANMGMGMMCRESGASISNIDNSNLSHITNSNLSPLTTRTQQLPHNGLFIRRNNQFGTRMSVGIKDLIEQGIIVDHTNIRFDDFVALNSERVPSPQADNSLAISYGIAPISLSQKRDNKATHYLEIALKASANAPELHPKNQATPVNYIFVVDTSGSMSGEKLDAVKNSIQELFKKLKENDVIGVIEFDDRPKTLLAATLINKINLDRFSELLSNMRASGGTDLNVALSFGVAEISRHGKNDTLNHIYLFTDGNPTSGETDWIKIRQNIDAKTRGNIRLSTFAFGSDANLRELDALAGLTGGKSTFVTSPEDIQISLEDELSRREHLAAINVQIKVDFDRDIEILYLYGHDLVTDPATRAAVLQDVEIAKEKSQKEFGVTPEADLVTQEKGIRIFVPNLAIGETYWIVFELAIPEDKQQKGIGKATVQYLDTFTRQNQKPEWELSFPGNLPPDLVVEHGLALWTSEVAFYTIDDLYEQDITTAKKRIESHYTLLCSVSKVLGSSYLCDDAITLEKFLSLFENLGKLRAVSEVSSEVQAYYVYSLSQFGRVRNGFNRLDYSSTSDQIV